MLHYTVVFFIIAIIAAVFGFGGMQLVQQKSQKFYFLSF